MVLPEFPWSNLCVSPEYMSGYGDGYQQAKIEMQELLNKMQAFYESTTTTVEIGGQRGE